MKRRDFHELFAEKIRLTSNTLEDVARKIGRDVSDIEEIFEEKTLPSLDLFALIISATGMNRRDVIELLFISAGISEQGIKVP